MASGGDRLPYQQTINPSLTRIMHEPDTMSGTTGMGTGTGTGTAPAAGYETVNTGTGIGSGSSHNLLATQISPIHSPSQSSTSANISSFDTGEGDSASVDAVTAAKSRSFKGLRIAKACDVSLDLP